MKVKEFCIGGHGPNPARYKDGDCIACAKQRSINRRASHPEQLRATKYKSSIRRLYGLTMEAYEAMKTQQAALCAVCHRPKKLMVDHDHNTGAVRGLLCYGCNTAIGLLQDDLTVIRSLQRYLS